jgi:LDH2 family malate/lactate/ureidoglycolate dehydrogenase
LISNHLHPFSGLVSFCCSVFERCRFSPENALISAQFLTRADLRGIDSHGVARLSGYVRLIQSGRLNPNPEFSFFSRFPTQIQLDADRSIGFLSSVRAMQLAMEAAEKFGVGMVAVKNSNHFGIAGQYALMAAEKGMIGMAMTNASPLVAPTHSRSRMLGTNPISVAVPSLKSRPFVLDMATTTAANGKLEILQRKHEKAPMGWIQTAEGSDSEDPEELKSGGALRPLGSFPHSGSHKGYGLGAMVDIFSGVLSGANFGPWVPPFVAFLPLASNLVGDGIGHFFLAFRPDGFMDQAEFLSRMEVWMEALRTAKPIGQDEILIPGDPEWKTEEERTIHGIPLLPAVVEDLNRLASELEISPFFAT